MTHKHVVSFDAQHLIDMQIHYYLKWLCKTVHECVNAWCPVMDW